MEVEMLKSLFVLFILFFNLSVFAGERTLVCGSGIAGDEKNNKTTFLGEERTPIVLSSKTLISKISASTYPGGHGELYSIIIEVLSKKDDSAVLYSKIITVEDRPQDIILYKELSIRCMIK